MCDTRFVFAGSVAVIGALPLGEESLPRDSGRISDPRLFRLCITAGGVALLDDLATGNAKPCVNLLQLLCVFHLNAEMVQAGFPASR